MNNYNPKIHHRRSIRLRGYDYSRAGLYFITICIKDRLYLFGKIENGVIILNDAGKMIEKWYYELENKYPDKKCHEMVVMPNHFHCIIENLSTDAHVLPSDAHVSSSDAHVSPSDAHVSSSDAHVGASLRGRPENDKRPKTDGNPENDDPDKRPKNIISPYGIDNKKYNATIGDAMDWLKTMTTNAYIRGVKNNDWQPFNKKLWQRDYWDHIIRDKKSYQRISEYIIKNPGNWENDRLK